MSIIYAASRSAIVAAALVAVSPIAQASWDGFDGKLQGLKVLASQIALATKAKNTAAQRLAEATMSARSSLTSFVNQLELYQGFGPMSGQGVNVCDAVNQRNDIAAIAQKMHAYDIGNVRRAGQLDLPAHNYASAKTNIMLDKFCSAEEHNLGICQASYDAAGAYARDFSMLSQAEQLTSKQVQAMDMFVANLVGDKSPIVQPKGECSPACMQARMQRNQVNASASLAAYGLAMSVADKVGAKSYAPLKTGASND